MRCANCSRELPNDSEFCQFCGVKLSEEVKLGVAGSYTGLQGTQEQYARKQKLYEAELKARAEEDERRENLRKKRKKLWKIIILSLLAAGVVTASVILAIPEIRYQHGCHLLKEGKYEQAQEIFEELGSYSDSLENIRACEYGEAKEYIAGGDYQAAIDIFMFLGAYEDSQQLKLDCYGKLGDESYEAGKYKEAIAFYKQAQYTVFSSANFADCYFEQMLQAMSSGDWETAYENWGIISKVKDMGEYTAQLLEQYITSLLSLNTMGDCNKALAVISGLDAKYKTEAIAALEAQCNNAILELKYQAAVALVSSGQHDSAVRAFEEILDYKDSSAYYASLTKWTVTFAFNNSKTDESTALDSLSHENTNYVHMLLSGGKINETVNLSFVFTFPDGYQVSDKLGDSLRNGDSEYRYWTDGHLGYATMQVYNADTGELLGEGSVYIY